MPNERDPVRLCYPLKWKASQGHCFNIAGKLASAKWSHIHFSKMFHDQAMDKDVTPTHAAQEDQVNGIVKEGN